MAIRDDLLVPIQGNNPSGENLRYSPVTEKIKEARRKEDPLAQGDWQRALKEADYRLVVKLSIDALKRNSKDLQVAAWLTEALVYQEGLPGLTAGLDVLHGLLENFWDTVYPEIDEGELGMRAAPLAWVGEYRELENAVRSIKLTRSGYDWFKYKEARTVGYEADIGESDSKKQARRNAIADGKLTAEQFDEDVSTTALAGLEEVVSAADTALQSLKLLDELCQDRFGDEAPGFRILRLAIEDVQHTARMLVAAKREKEPQPEAEPVSEPEEIIEDSYSIAAPSIAASAPAAAAAAAPARRAAKAVTAEPVDRDDALGRVAAVAGYLRREDPASPVPYLLTRALRWGELRASTDGINPDLLEAPSSEIRQRLKRFMLDGQWDQVLETAESAMVLPCGRGWLDLQRYVVRACSELGSTYDAIAFAVKSELRALLKDLPGLPGMTLLDDTATANTETQSWLAELFPPDLPPPVQAEPVEELEPVVTMQESEPAEEGEEAEVDAYELALDEARSGNMEGAMQILVRQISQERSGRGRFNRRMQLAQICIFSNRHAIAYPLLEDLAKEIETRNLESWEQPETIAQTLALLLQSMQKLRLGEEEKRKIYSQICRLDPVQAARLSD